MEREKDPKDLRGEEPRPGDDAHTALEKSGAIDERVHDGTGGTVPAAGLVGGAPPGHIPSSVGMPGSMGGGSDEAEHVLELERKAQRARGDIQRG